MVSFTEHIMRACGYTRLIVPRREQKIGVPGGVIETARKNCGHDVPTDAELYYAIGYRDAGNFLAYGICEYGLVHTVTKALEILQKNDPDNTRVGPAMKIVKEHG